MAVVRWVFEDPETLDEYTFEVNPSEGGSPNFEKKVTEIPTVVGDPLIFEGARPLQKMQFQGVILTEEHYNAMVEWFNKAYPLIVTDDLGRSFRIYITTFSPTRQRAVHYPWKHSYTVNYILLEEL